MLEAKNLKKIFNEKTVLDDVSILLKNGCITALIGKNGAGKSTLIASILSYYKLDDSSVKKEKISVMPEAKNPFENLTGYEFLKLMKKLKKSRNFKRALLLSDKLGMRKNLNKKIKEYSFGMKKKIFFIQTILGKSGTYFFDEPTSGVDGPSAEIMIKVINELKLQGAAILITSHNLDELERISDYVYIIEKGKIIKEGSVSDITQKGKSDTYILKSRESNIIYNLFQKKYNFLGIDHEKIELNFADENNLKEFVTDLTLCNLSFYELYKYKRSLRQSVY